MKNLYIILLLIFIFTNSCKKSYISDLESTIHIQNPALSEKYLEKGIDLANGGDFQKAIENIEFSIKYNVENHRAFYNLALINLELRKYELAESLLKKSLKLSKNSKKYLKTLDDLRKIQEKKKDAIDDLYSLNEETRKEAAYVLSKIGDKESIDALKWALKYEENESLKTLSALTLSKLNDATSIPNLKAEILKTEMEATDLNRKVYLRALYNITDTDHKKKSGMDHLIDMLNSTKYTHMKIDILSVFSEKPRKEIYVIFLMAINETDIEIKRLAINTLIKLNLPEAKKKIYDLLKKNQEELVIYEVLKYFSIHYFYPIYKKAIIYLEHHNDQIRFYAAKVIGDSNNRSYLKQLLNRLKIEENEDVKDQISRAIYKINQNTK